MSEDAIELFQLATCSVVASAAAKRLFESTRARLAAVLPAGSQILHIGATAIPGCLTKGDLDIVVRVPPALFAASEAVLAGLYERNSGSVRTETFAAFKDDTSAPPLGVQLTAIGGTYDDFHRFMERLLADADLINDYNDLKRQFDGRSMEAYRAAKDEFVARVLNADAPRS